MYARWYVPMLHTWSSRRERRGTVVLCIRTYAVRPTRVTVLCIVLMATAPFPPRDALGKLTVQGTGPRGQGPPMAMPLARPLFSFPSTELDATCAASTLPSARGGLHIQSLSSEFGERPSNPSYYAHGEPPSPQTAPLTTSPCHALPV